MAGRPKKGVKKSGSLKRIIGGRPPKLASASDPNKIVGFKLLTPKSKKFL